MCGSLSDKTSLIHSVVFHPGILVLKVVSVWLYQLTRREAVNLAFASFQFSGAAFHFSVS